MMDKIFQLLNIFLKKLIENQNSQPHPENQMAASSLTLLWMVIPVFFENDMQD